MTFIQIGAFSCGNSHHYTIATPAWYLTIVPDKTNLVVSCFHHKIVCPDLLTILTFEGIKLQNFLNDPILIGPFFRLGIPIQSYSISNPTLHYVHRPSSMT